jgi:hypothetical protein
MRRLRVSERTFALRFLVEIFTGKKYVTAMNDAIVPLANAEEELLLHISSLRSTGVDIILEIINKINSFGNSNCAGSSGKLTGLPEPLDVKPEICCAKDSPVTAVHRISKPDCRRSNRTAQNAPSGDPSAVASRQAVTTIADPQPMTAEMAPPSPLVKKKVLKVRSRKEKRKKKRKEKKRSSDT